MNSHSIEFRFQFHWTLPQIRWNSILPGITRDHSFVRVSACARVCARTDACAHVAKHTTTRAFAIMHPRMSIRARTYTHKLPITRTSIRAHTHTRTYAYARARRHTHVHAHVHVRALTASRIRLHIHSPIHQPWILIFHCIAIREART